jgi:hypothetical protein
MSLSAKDIKAIGWYIGQKKLKPMISNPPLMHFRTAAGEEITQDLGGIVSEYNAWSADDRKERARESRIKKLRSTIRSVV